MKDLIKNIYSLILSFVLIAVFMTGSHAQKVSLHDDKAVSLAELWARAEKNSPAIKARLKEIEAIDHSINSLPKPYRPAIGANLGYSGAANIDSIKHGPLSRLTAEWTLWDGGRTKYSKSLLKRTLDVQVAQNIIFANEVKRKIAIVYIEAASLDSAIGDDELKIKDLISVKKLLIPRLKIGRIGISDVDDISIRIDEVAGKIRSDRLIHNFKRKQLAMLAGDDGSKPVDLPGLPLLKGMEVPESLMKTKDGGTGVMLAKRRLAYLEEKIEYRKSQLYWPTFGIELHGGYGPHRDVIDPFKPEIGAGAVFRVPLISSGDRSAEIASITAEIEAARLDLAQAMRDAEISTDQLIASILAFKMKIVSLEKTILQASKNLTASYSEFSRGLKSPADMLSSVQNLYDLKSRFNEARTEYLIHKAELYLMYEQYGGISSVSINQ